MVKPIQVTLTMGRTKRAQEEARVTVARQSRHRFEQTRTKILDTRELENERTRLPCKAENPVAPGGVRFMAGYNYSFKRPG